MFVILTLLVFLRSLIFGLTTDVTLPLALGVGRGSGRGG